MSENVFAAPASTPETATPALYSPTTVALCTFFFTPLTGAATQGANHWRCRNTRAALQIAALGPVAFVLAGALPLLLPESLSRGAGIGLTVGAVMGLHRDAKSLQARYPAATTASALVPVAGGVLVLLVLVALPTLIWIVTGAPA